MAQDNGFLVVFNVLAVSQYDAVRAGRFLASDYASGEILDVIQATGMSHNELFRESVRAGISTVLNEYRVIIHVPIR